MYLEIAEEKLNKLKNEYKKRDIIVLAIESSCDETSVAILKNGREILSNIISSQIDIHAKFGGVVPEVASRNHLMAITGVVNKALEEAKVTLADIDAIGVTYGAGLVGALMVGVNYAKSLAYALEVPLIKVNHIKGHISANYIAHPDLKPPFISLIVSGGHTAIVKVENYLKNTLIGSTIDDAIGESYDKVAKCLGLGYPGGPKIDKLAKEGKNNITFVSHGIMADGYNFSYSGLKTAVINYIHKLEQKGEKINKADVCASFQDTAVMEVVNKTLKAAKKHRIKTIAVAGGVAANSYLREKLTTLGEQQGVKVLFPPMILCTDNAAMIAAEAYNNIIYGEGLADIDLTAVSNLHLKYSVK